MSVLTLNCGSSSVKYAVYDPAAGDFLCRGLLDRVGFTNSVLRHKTPQGEIRQERDCPDHVQAVAWVLEALTTGDSPPVRDKARIRAVGHRVVHGGEKFAKSTLVTPEMIAEIERLSNLAPLHNPPNLTGIRAAQKLLPGIPNVAVFDTAFHQTMPPEAYVYPLPYRWYETHGIRRYGFHGTSHLYVSRRAAVVLRHPLDKLRLVTLHIGNGASAAAVLCGRSVDTSMGFTPLEGLVMGTRSGWIDPAIPLFVMEREKMSVGAIDRTLNKESGLLGITGRFSDRRDIEQAAREGDERCRLSMEIETRTLRKTIASYAAVMGGVDAVVFTAGVGENSAEIRRRTLAGLEFLGLFVDAQKNEEAKGGREEKIISSPDSRVKVLVIPTNEERVIVEDTLAILEGRFESPDFHYSFG